MTWTDETSYQRGERGNIPPRTWSTKVGALTIIVTRHIHWPDTWLVNCRQLYLDQRDLHTGDVEEAKRRAIVRIKELVASSAT
jgi:hypothetical protein